MGRWRYALLAALAIAGVTAAASSRAEDSVSVAAGTHEGYGRIAFAWPDAVKFEAQLDGHTVTIHFARPLKTDVSALPRRLPNYVDGASQSGEQDVVITLHRELSLRSFATEDKKVVIDLLDRAPQAKALEGAKATEGAKPVEAAQSGEAAKPAAAKAAEDEPAPKPATASPLAVKVLDKDGGHRLVFDWPKRVDYVVGTGTSAGRLRFKAAPPIDGERLAAELPDLAPTVAMRGGDVALAFNLPPGGHLRAARQGNRVIVDVTGGKAPLPQHIEPKAGSANAWAPPEQAGTEPAKAGAEPAKAAVAPAERADAAPAAAPRPEPVGETKPLEPAKPAEGAKAGEPARPADPPLALARAAGQLPLRYATGDDVASLRFEWKDPVGMAMFRRANTLWIVFGAPLPVDLAELRANGRAAVREVDQVPHPSATILRLTTVGGFNPSVRRSDSAWVVELRPQLLRPEAPVGVGIQANAEAPRVFFAVRDPGQPVVFRDPEIGDTLIAVPVQQVGQGVAREERLVDFTAFLTAQGIALRPDSDAIVAKPLPNGVEVTSMIGLFLSDEADRQRRRSDMTRGIFNFTDWFGPKDGDVLAQRRALEANIVAGSPAARSASRLDLAHFYFAHGYAPEALGVLGAIERDDPNFAADPPVRALTGGAMLLAGDLEGAERELGQATLDDEPEIALWRGSLAYAKRDWRRAEAEFARGEARLRRYPKGLRNRFALEAADAALLLGQHEDADDYIAMVFRDKPGPGDRAAAELLAARSLGLKGETEKADALYGKLAAGSDRPTRARATLTRTLDELEAGTITRPEAIQKLDGLRFAWRGDDFELTLLRRLGELRVKDGDYRGGFEAWRQAISFFPDHPDRKAIEQQLGQGFADIYLGPESDKVPPLRALALYDEFKDLMPSGAQGDEIIRILADRLVAIDLLDRAAALLDDQVKARLQGRDKARVAARLAVVRLLDRKPKEALDALDIEIAGDVDPDLKAQRRQLRARALTELGRLAEAKDVLDGDNSRDADRLRADIAWRGKKWGEASQVLARLVPPEVGGKLDDDAARTVLSLGTTLTLAGDKEGLAELGRKYGAAMEASKLRDVFRVIGDGSLAAGDVRSLVSKVAQVSDLQSFMAAYKQKVQSEKLSAIN